MEKILEGITNPHNKGIIIAKNLTGFCYVNEFVANLFGYTKDELLEINFLSPLLDSEDDESSFNQYLSIMEQETSKAKLNARFVRKDRSVFTATLDITTHKDSGGESVMVLQFTNVRETGEFADESKVNYQKIAQEYDPQHKTGVIIFTMKELAYANKLCYEAFDYNRNAGEVMPSNHTKLIASSSLIELTKKTIKVYTGFSPKETFSCKFTQKNGDTFYADLTLNKHKEGKEKYLVLQLDNIDLGVAV